MAEQLTLSRVRERAGWTDAAIKKFLGEPDETRRNPRYRSAAPTKLYNVERVEEAEATSAWSEWRAKNAKRSEAAADAAQKRRHDAAVAYEAAAEKFLAEFGTPRVKLRFNGSYEQLIEHAIAAYNEARELQRWDRNYADASSDPNFIGRITTNYLRHSCTNYDALIALCSGQPGGGEAYQRVVDAVGGAMDDAFPELREHVFAYQLNKQLSASC